MSDIKDQGEVVRTTISTRRGALFWLDNFASLIEGRTKLTTPRGKLITLAANIFHAIRDEVDCSQIHDDATLQHEVIMAIIRKYGREVEKPGKTKEDE